MNTNGKQVVLLVILGLFLVSSTGCATGRLPWLAKKKESSAMDDYVAQAASNIQYNTDVDMTQDYKQSARPVSSYTASPTQTSSRSSGGSSESCSSGCCH